VKQRLPVVALGAALLACGPEQPDVELTNELVYESDRVKVFVEAGTPFCRGDGARMDAHIEALAQDFGVAPPEQVPVWVVGDAIDHELNHAVFERLEPDAEQVSKFWFEAYASAWETDFSEYPYYTGGLEEQAEHAASEQARHFIRWLQATHGTAALADFYASLTDQGFADVFGASYEQTFTQFKAEAAKFYPGFRWCEDAELIEVPLGETHVSLRADCDAADTHTFDDPPIEAMYVRRILRLGDEADLHIEFSSPARIVRVHPCFDGAGLDWDDPRQDNDWYDYGGSGGVPTMELVSQREQVAAGDNLFAFAVPLGDPVDLELVITATPPSDFEGEPPPAGQFLFALSSDLSPGLPLQFILTVDNPADPYGWLPNFTLQPLSLELGSQTAPREPVGPPLVENGVGVSQLYFEFSSDDYTIPGAANPNDGTDVAWLGSYVYGNFVGPDAICGGIEAGSWFDLIGGTFAAIRVDDTSPAALPQQFPSSCDELP
jgi:hypothetical protein